MPKFLDDIIAVGGSKVLLNATSTAFSDKLYVSSDAYTTGGWRVGSAATYVGKTYNSSGKLTMNLTAIEIYNFKAVTTLVLCILIPLPNKLV